MQIKKHTWSYHKVTILHIARRITTKITQYGVEICRAAQVAIALGHEITRMAEPPETWKVQVPDPRFSSIGACMLKLRSPPRGQLPTGVAIACIQPEP